MVKLVDVSFVDMVFFINFGIEFCEFVVKMVWKYWYEKGEIEKI